MRGLPIKLGRCSNGEFVPPPTTAVVQEAVRRAEALSAENARRLNMSRRRFLASTCGAATTLFALAACSKEAHEASGSTTTAAPGGTFAVPPEATTESTVADAVVGGGEVIVDVQTHLLEFDPAHPPAGDSFGSGFPQGSCGEAEWWQCFSVDHWMEKVFLESDTTMAVISAVPVVSDHDPLSIEIMERGRQIAEQLCGDGRVLIQGHAVPNVGELGAALDDMAALVDAHPIAAWKLYTHYGRGFRLTEDDEIGSAFLGKVEELGVDIVSVHKGFSGGDSFAAPADIGPAALAHPAINFVVYHSGFEPGNAEGEFRADGKGVDRLVRTLSESEVAPGSNVYAELGSTWRTVMGSPDEAAHVLGKLLVAVGPDNILWGTDSIWYGSPQDQIQAFRAFEITPEFQERYGYPALTPETKAKILGLNAARVYKVDPATVPCRFSREELARIREEQAMVPATEGPVSTGDVAATFRRDHPWF